MSYDLDKFFELSPDFCWIGAPDGTLDHASAALRRVLGWGAVADEAARFLDLLHPDDVAAAKAALVAIVEGPQSLEFDARLRQADGRHQPVRWMGMGDPETQRLFVRGRTIEERERLDAVMAAEGRYFRGLVEHTVDIILVTAAEGELRYLSPAFERSLGFSVEAWRDKNVADLVWPEDRESMTQVFRQSQQHPEVVQPWRARLCHADGSHRWFVGSATNRLDDPHVTGIVINAHDVTEQVENLEALQKSEALLEEAQRIGRIASFEMDLTTDTMRSSKALLDLSREGLPVSDPTQGWRQRLLESGYTEDSEKRALAAIEYSIETGDAVDLELERKAEREQWHWLYLRAAVVNDAQGTPLLLRGIVQDISERKRAERLMEIKDRAIATSINGIAIADAEGKIIYVNPAFLRMWGYEREEEAVGRSPLEFGDPERTAEIVDALQLRGVWKGEATAQRRDGSHFDTLVAANILLDAGGNISHMVGAFQDISESKRLQSQFAQAQKMESVGRLAGGVAHDFNNALTVISGYTELALAELPNTDNLNEYLTEIQQASHTAASLTEQLLAFSRKQIIAPRVLDLNETLAKMEPMLARIIGEDVQLEVILSEDLGHVRMDPGQAEQVILNLAVNARDAMPDGGKLTLEATNVSLDEAYSARHVGVQPGRYVVLAVSDDGGGMSEEVRKQIFEPFFTTKEAGKGTGLGLAMVYGAVRQNGGNVEVYSEVGRGTTFKLYWPRVDASADEVEATTFATLPRGSETLILVEDEARVRRVAKLMLERQGYTVHAFESGPAALQGLTSIDEPVHMLLTDVIMPEMNGQVLSQRVLELRPDLKVLFASGYTANVIVHHGILKDGVEFLAKPYTHAALAQRVREVLDK
ncbi:MAG: PAS domain S-box protein [Myxococcales bacterium]|nr:PAS domain S-box protein [Myxococcales bacterium]